MGRLSDVFYMHLPQLSSFSALRMLYYVTPCVMSTDLYMHYYLAQEHYVQAKGMRSRVQAVLPFFGQICLTAFYFIFGFDAFLVKYRMASDYIRRHDVHFDSILGAMVFLFQMLGVVNLHWFVKNRLFLFIFGGDDCNLDASEKARWTVWLNILTKRTYAHFGLFYGTLVMLGFDDYDFQKLVLDDAPPEPDTLETGLATRDFEVRDIPAVLESYCDDMEDDSSRRRTHPIVSSRLAAHLSEIEQLTVRLRNVFES